MAYTGTALARMAVLVVNFAHPLSAANVAEIGEIVGQPVERVLDVPCDMDPGCPFLPQVRAVIDSVGLENREWQLAPILINPPSLNLIAVILVAELAGRMGHLPTCLRVARVTGATPTRFAVVEIVNLQDVRDRARRARSADPDLDHGNARRTTAARHRSHR